MRVPGRSFMSRMTATRNPASDSESALPSVVRSRAVNAASPSSRNGFG